MYAGPPRPHASPAIVPLARPPPSKGARVGPALLPMMGDYHQLCPAPAGPHSVLDQSRAPSIYLNRPLLCSAGTGEPGPTPKTQTFTYGLEHSPIADQRRPCRRACVRHDRCLPRLPDAPQGRPHSVIRAVGRSQVQAGTHLPLPMGVLSTKSPGLKLKKPSASFRNVPSRALSGKLLSGPIRAAPRCSPPAPAHVATPCPT